MTNEAVTRPYQGPYAHYGVNLSFDILGNDEKLRDEQATLLQAQLKTIFKEWKEKAEQAGLEVKRVWWE